MPTYRTALITGASSGLGREFARHLAAQGSGVCLVARRADQLAEVAAELSDRYGVRTEVLPADLTVREDLDRVEERLADPARPVDLLVNSAGLFGGSTGPLALLDPCEEERKIALNVTALVRLTRAVLPGMVRREHGGVLNVSSVAGFLPAPGAVTYAASKAFITSFSESLHGEVCSYGVHVTSLCPGSTRTPLHESAGRRGGRLGPLLEPDAVVREGIAAVAAGRPVCVPGPSYRRKVLLARSGPRALVRRSYYKKWGSKAARALAALRG
nr:putative dehydrogenase [uncultured bacterium]